MGPKDIGNNNSSNSKKKEAEEQQQKRPGSAVSREFQPSSRQKAGPLWRKPQPTEANEQKQQQIYGSHYVPFKSAAATAPAASIYGTAIRPSNPPQQLQPNDYLHSIYAPPQLVRQNRQLQHPETAIINHRGAVGAGVAQIHHQPPENINMAQNHHHQQQIGGSRPGSDLGIYKMMSSRCQSYTTLPRPEHGPPELLMEEMVPVAFTKSQPAQLYGTREGGVAITQIPFRPPSAASRSLGRKNSTTAGPLPPAYFGGPNIFAPGIADFGLSADYGRRDGHHTKELVPWGIVSLSSWLTIVFGTAIFCLGAVRLYWRADFAKGQELFYGISAICAGLVGFFASQNRSFSMFVAAFLLCCLNVVFIFVPFLSGILPLMPLLSSNGKPYISLGGTKEPVEVDIGLAVLSLMQLAAAFSLLLYGCRAFGTAMKHVEQLKMGLEHSAAMAATSPRVDSGGKI